MFQGCLVIISQHDHTQKKASMLQDMHYRNISQRLVLLRRTEEAAKYLEATKLQTSNGFSEEFTVMEDLMGLAIGECFLAYCLTIDILYSRRCSRSQYPASQED